MVENIIVKCTIIDRLRLGFSCMINIQIKPNEVIDEITINSKKLYFLL